MKISRLAIIIWIMPILQLGLVGCAKKEAIAPTPARDVLFSGQATPTGYGAYGYLIFTKRPSENDMDRYLKVCDAYNRYLDPVSEYTKSSRPNIMPTFWLAKEGKGVDNRKTDCEAWVKFYDYARAKSVARLTNVLSKKGPILVAWRHPYEMVEQNEEALVLDLSKFSNDDLDRAFGIWLDRITRDPKIWHDGFNLILVRESFRNFLEKYGDDILQSIKSVKELVG